MIPRLVTANPGGKTLRTLATVVFALFPVAYMAGIALEIRSERRQGHADFHLTSTRAQAISAARAFMAGHGIDTAHWSVACAAFPNPDLFQYYRLHPGPASDRAAKIFPAAVVRLLFESPVGNQRAAITLSFENQILGFDLRNAARESPTPEVDDQTSLALAQSLLTSESALATVFGAARPEVMNSDRTPAGVTRTYTWRQPFPGLRELDSEFRISVRNGQVLNMAMNNTVDRDYVSRALRSKDGKILDFLSVLRTLLIFAVVIYSVVGYARRTTQKEVSHKRTLWMILLLALLFGSFIYWGPVRDDFELGETTITGALGLSGVLLAFMAQSLLAGLAYGGGEGDVREAYPGKLTSLDALVLGKVFSKNVGASVLAGVACAGWLLFAKGILMIPIAAVTSSQGLGHLKFPFMAAPFFTLLIAQPGGLFVFSVLGLLQPLAFVSRYIRNPKARIVILVLFALTVVSGLASDEVSIPSFLAMSIILTAGLVVPFFLYDLLAALISLVALEFVDSLVQIVVVFPGWVNFAVVMGGMAAATVAIEYIAWRRGRAWRDEEVRPEYARHIAERQSLQEEVSAAREAQLRLLPQDIPSVPGFSIYASCLPARVVGGDFYDFFPLSHGRLGIFIAEGGNRGMASALSIALAKGYLMHVTRGPYSPTQVVQKLESTLGSILDAAAARTTVAYAVIDARAGTLDYARTGSYPRVITAPADTVERQVPLAGHDGIWEGSAFLVSGQSIFFYTDGIARALSASTIQLAALHPSRTAEGIHGALLNAIGAGHGSAHEEREDDLTAVVVRCTHVGAQVGEGVA